MGFKEKLIGGILIIIGALPFLLKIKSISNLFTKNKVLSYIMPGEIIYQLIIIFLGILLILAVSYIIFEKWQAAEQREQLSIFQQGAQYGYEQAVLQLMQQAITCEPVPIFVKNQTINLIAVECLQQMQQQYQGLPQNLLQQLFTGPGAQVQIDADIPRPMGPLGLPAPPEEKKEEIKEEGGDDDGDIAPDQGELNIPPIDQLSEDERKLGKKLIGNLGKTVKGNFFQQGTIAHDIRNEYSLIIDDLEFGYVLNSPNQNIRN